ncbi:MAG TPA: hypothetical protein VNO53_07725 [Steroidobacteraceae bacterium]|nr:hypothetical protein [Steroidobacteraceae bacterium]
MTACAPAHRRLPDRLCGPRRPLARRPLLLCAAAALLAAAIPSAAQAETQVQLDGRLSPVIREVPRQPPSMTLRMTARFIGDGPGFQPPILDHSVIRFPYGSRLNNRLFPHCDPALINRRGPDVCPSGSLIGRGYANVFADTERQRLTVRMFNGRDGKSIVFYFHGSNPARVDVAFAAPLRRLRGGMWNYVLNVPVPETLQVVAGIPIYVREFVSTVGATRRVNGRRLGFIEAWSCPPGGQAPVRGDFDFLESDPVGVRSWIRCG